jgi:two-component system, NarL family, sensor histidine kinase UhpB
MSVRPANVLLIEDDPGTSHLIQRILSSKSQHSLKCSVQTASTLADALKCLGSTAFDNILLDLNLPDSNGVSTIRQIHDINPDVPIMVLTGSNDRRMEMRARRLGIDDYIVKGSDAWDSLVNHIKYVIERKKALDSIKLGIERYRSIFELAPVAIVCISPRGRIVDINKTARGMWSLKKNKVIGKSFLNTCIPEGDRFRFYSELVKVLSGQKIKPIETSMTCSEGKTQLLFWNFDRLTNEDGSVLGLIAAAHNISRDALDINKTLIAPSLTLNPHFNETVSMILTSLSAILKKVKEIKDCPEPCLLRKLADENPCSQYDTDQLGPQKADAIEKLILSLITPDESK